MAATSTMRKLAEALLAIVIEIAGGSAGGAMKVRLLRKVGLLAHLVQEIRDSVAKEGGDGDATTSACLADLLLALQAARRFLGRRTPADVAHSDLTSKNAVIQFQFVTWQLEKALGNLQFEYFEVSDEVQEEVELVRAQLRRDTERNGMPNLIVFQEICHTLSHRHGNEVKRQLTGGEFQIQNTGNHDREFHEIVILVAEVNGKSKGDAEEIASNLIERLRLTEFADDTASVADMKSSNLAIKSTEEIKRSDSPVIPEDFRCPISLELMKDPVIVSTGQTYERSFIQRWIDCGHGTCPKTQQKLQNVTLTPNYVLRSLIMQWCETNRIEQPSSMSSRRTRKSDGSFDDVSEEQAAINELVHNLSSSSLEEQRSAAAEIRLLAKRSRDNRIMIAEAGAIPSLVNLLSVDDSKIQEHAVTSLLNLSIYDNNKDVIMLAGAIIPIVEVLRKGSMEARENAAAAVFSLSLNDENKITIGGTSGVIESLVELLQNGSPRGKKDAATALFNLCIYPGNKARAVRSGILTPLLHMLKDPSNSGMVDEALTVLTVLVSHQEGKMAIVKANTIPLLIDLLRTGQARNRENASAILLVLCKKDTENLAYIGRLGAVIPLTELALSGSERAKRKAIYLLNHLSKLQSL